MRLPAILFAVLWCAQPGNAQTLCDETDETRIADMAIGTWSGSANRALENETLSQVSTDIPEVIEIAGDASRLIIASRFLDNLRSEAFALRKRSELYDDEQIEEVLGGTKDTPVSDKLTERTCSAYALPQLEAVLPKTEGISASGTVTLIFYRADLALQLSDLTLESPEAVIYATESAWVSKAEGE